MAINLQSSKPNKTTMAGIALLMDLLKKNPSINGQTLHSTGLYSATVAVASAAAAYVASGIPFASTPLFGFLVILRDFYKKTFMEPAVDVLGILPDACRSKGNKELGDVIASEIHRLKPEDAGNLVQLVHNHASSAGWDGVGQAWV